MKHTDMARLRNECLDGNTRACDTLERLCAEVHEEACIYVP